MTAEAQEGRTIRSTQAKGKVGASGASLARLGNMPERLRTVLGTKPRRNTVSIYAAAARGR